jgi:hypothetical protein
MSASPAPKRRRLAAAPAAAVPTAAAPAPAAPAPAAPTPAAPAPAPPLQLLDVLSALMASPRPEFAKLAGLSAAFYHDGDLLAATAKARGAGGATRLHRAVTSGRAAARVPRLLAVFGPHRGAVSLRRVLLACPDARGYTALHSACAQQGGRGSVQLAGALLQAGAPWDASTGVPHVGVQELPAGVTPLHLAAAWSAGLDRSAGMRAAAAAAAHEDGVPALLPRAPTVIVLRGPSGCGKSSLARRVIESLPPDVPAAVASADSYFVGPDGAYRFVPEALRDAHQASGGSLTPRCATACRS